MQPKTILFFTISLTVLAVISGVAGIAAPSMYEAATFYWQVQTVWQDYTNVFFVTPVLVLSGIFASKGSKIASAIWTGALLYLCYTYAIFAFSVHFNRNFLFYCILLGLSFYALLWFFHSGMSKTMVIHRAAWWLAIYLILTGSLLYFTWLADVWPGIVQGMAPSSVERAGLFTNPVHVLDLSLLLPGYIVCGILLLDRNELGYLTAPMFLSFGAIMGISITVLQFALFINDLVHSLFAAFVMLFLTAVNIYFLAHHYSERNMTQSKKDFPVQHL